MDKLVDVAVSQILGGNELQLISFYEQEELKAKGASIIQLPFADAASFTFGNEPTIAQVVYVQHPRIESRLVPYGQYDSLVMTDKFNEALRIVQSLGAHTVVTRSYRGDLSKLSLRGFLPQGGAGAEAEKSNRDEISYDQVGTGGPPIDPGESAYPDEAGFEAARRGVILNGARHVGINIESQSAFRADSDIATRLKKLGFSLGATAERAQVRLLRLDAYFPQEGELHKPDPDLLRPLVEAKPPMDPATKPEKGAGWRRRKRAD